MTNQQTRLCQLMLEFDELCKRSEVKYYLIGHQLLFAYRKNGIHGYELDIAMFMEDWLKIVAQIDDSDQYEIESISEKGNMLGCYYRFVDKNTLMLDVDLYGRYAKPGIAINVHIFRDYSLKSKYLLFLENGNKNLILDNQTRSRDYVEKKILKNGKAAFCEKLEQLLRSVSLKKSTDSGMAVLYEPKAKICKIPLIQLKKQSVVAFQGMRLTTFGNPRVYLAQRYGGKWRKINPKIAKETYRCVFSTTLPYADYMREVEGKGLLTREFSQMAREYGPKYAKYQKMEKTEIAGWEKTLFAAGERFRLWKKYEPQKAELMRLFKENQFDHLEIILRDYILILRKYLKMNIVICFDDDILDIVKVIYLKNGNEAVVKKIDRCISSEDLMPIIQTW